jgi:hypothetical protein
VPRRKTEIKMRRSGYEICHAEWRVNIEGNRSFSKMYIEGLVAAQPT